MFLTQDQLDRMTDRALSVVTTVVVHHTADDSVNKDIAEVAREEEASQGFVTIGYHILIQGDGTVQYGRPIGKVPAANLGMNTESYAIALEGNFQPGDAGYKGEVPTDKQMSALFGAIINAKKKLPALKYLIGHRDVARIVADSNDATACPGDLLYNRLHNLRIITKLASL